MSKYGILKEHLRETLAAGAALGVEIKRSGCYAEADYWRFGDGQPIPNAPAMCLIGTVRYLTNEYRYPTFLGLDEPATRTVEAGFCGWAKEKKDNPELYRLGKSLAREFATDYGAKQ